MKFPFKYSTFIHIALAVVLIASLGGLAWNIFNLISYVYLGVFKIIMYSVIILLNLALCILALSLIFFGQYVINEKHLICCFGFIRSRYSISDITQVVLFKKSNKLVVYFNNNKYTVILISPAMYEDFTIALRKHNPSITYNTEIDGEEQP